MDPASFDPQLTKGYISQYCKDLIASIKINYILVEQSFFTVCSREMKNLSNTFVIEILFTGKSTSRKILFNLTEKASIRYC